MDNIVHECGRQFKTVSDILRIFGTYPGLITPEGIETMRKVGLFLARRYIAISSSAASGLVHPFVGHSYSVTDWRFVTREGYRHQISIDALALGIYPNTPIPVILTPSNKDHILGGPPPECAYLTSQMILKWQNSTGKDIVDSDQIRKNIVIPIEKICNVSLSGNPVHALPGGPNPHAWIGDINDMVEEWSESQEKKCPFNTKLRQSLSDLALKLEHGSHYDDPRASVWFSGGFVLELVSSFQQFLETKEYTVNNQKISVLLSSRELLYALIEIFNYQIRKSDKQELPKILPGSTFIWELHSKDDNDKISSDGKDNLIYSYYWHPSMVSPYQMMKPLLLNEFVYMYQNYVEKNGGPWYEQCDLKHYSPRSRSHDPYHRNHEYAELDSKYKRYIQNLHGNMFDANFEAEIPNESSNRVPVTVAIWFVLAVMFFSFLMKLNQRNPIVI